MKSYGDGIHDGFPPTIIAAVDALSAWGMNLRAAQLFRYWLAHFVRDNGTIDYYGPSLSEYGQLLHTAALLADRAGTAGWWPPGLLACLWNSQKNWLDYNQFESVGVPAQSRLQTGAPGALISCIVRAIG